MKLLITGMTNLQAGEITRRKRDYLSSVFILKDILEKTKGVEVEHRPIQFGENLKKYDLVLIGLSDFTSVSCIRAFHALWATKFPHLFFVNDWKVKPAFTNCRIEALYKEYTFRRTGSYYTDEQRAYFKRNKKQVAEMIAKVVNAKTVLAPLFNWGDSEILHKGTNLKKIYGYDPSPFLITGPLPTASEKIMKAKDKKWICGALYNYEKKVSRWGLEWPVEYYYNKNYIPEHELINEYKDAVGVISPGYNNAGSGWYRLRFIHALMTNSILFGSQKEVEPLGLAYGGNLADVEECDDRALAKIANAQQQAFMSFVKTKQVERKKIMNAIEEQL